jgi:hypothetical protein
LRIGLTAVGVAVGLATPFALSTGTAERRSSLSTGTAERRSSSAADDGGAVVWTNRVNVTVDGETLRKTNGCDGCDDAGATSQQTLTAGAGYVEFTVGETTTLWVAGLGHQNTDTTYADVDFGFRFNGAGGADVVENGVYQSGGDTTYEAGDVFRIAVIDGRVQYFRNGLLLRKSQKPPAYPLVLDVSLRSVRATVGNARLGSDPPPARRR